MGEVGEFFKRHPYAIAVGVFVVGVVLIYHFLGHKSSGGVDNSAFYNASAAAVASGNQLAAAQLNAQVQNNGIAAALAAKISADNANVALAQENTAAAKIAADAATTQTGIAAQSADTLAQIGAVVSQSKIAADQSVQTTAINANADVSKTVAFDQLQLGDVQSSLAAMVANHRADSELTQNLAALSYGFQYQTYADNTNVRAVEALANASGVGGAVNPENILALAQLQKSTPQFAFPTVPIG